MQDVSNIHVPHFTLQGHWPYLVSASWFTHTQRHGASANKELDLILYNPMLPLALVKHHVSTVNEIQALLLELSFRLQQGAFTHRNFYKQKLLHRKPFTQRKFYTEKPCAEKFLHTRAFQQMLFRTEAFTHTSLTHRSVTQNKKLLCTEAFTDRRLCTILHTDAFT